MKIYTTFLAFFVGAYVCAQTGDSIIIKYHGNGNIKQKISINQQRFKNGESLYYSEGGTLDSSVSFRKGKLYGLTKVYYSQDDIFHFNYRNDSLISHKIYDSTHNLKYESPLSLESIPNTTFHFTSGRNYFDPTKVDTLTVNTDIPFMNQHIYFPGATVIPINKSSWIIKAWKAQPNSKNGKMVVVTTQFGVEDSHVSQPQKQLREEIILIPIK